MSFRDSSWPSRYRHMGDQAEQVFEQVYPRGWVRWGLNRPPIAVYRLPPMIRFAPDYLTSKGFLEVQGVGRDQIVKLKTAKLEALLGWNKLFTTDLFIWDSKHHQYGFCTSIHDVADVAAEAETRSFREGNEYKAVPVAAMPMKEWVAHR